MGRSGKAQRFEEAGGRKAEAATRAARGKGREPAATRRAAGWWAGPCAKPFLSLFGWAADLRRDNPAKPLPRVPARGRSCINTRGGGAGLLQRGQRHRRRLCCH